VPGKILVELSQSKPYHSASTEAFVNIQRTAELHLQQIASLLKDYGISTQQYNVLRILRGAGENGVPCGQIAERMITHDPDITRLVDRLEKMEFAERVRQNEDRRVVRVRATQKALDLLAALDEPVNQLHERQFEKLAEDRRIELISLLEDLR